MKSYKESYIHGLTQARENLKAIIDFANLEYLQCQNKYNYVDALLREGIVDEFEAMDTYEFVKSRMAELSNTICGYRQNLSLLNALIESYNEFEEEK